MVPGSTTPFSLRACCWKPTSLAFFFSRLPFPLPVVFLLPFEGREGWAVGGLAGAGRVRESSVSAAGTLAPVIFWEGLWGRKVERFPCAIFSFHVSRGTVKGEEKVRGDADPGCQRGNLHGIGEGVTTGNWVVCERQLSSVPLGRNWRKKAI